MDRFDDFLAARRGLLADAISGLNGLLDAGLLDEPGVTAGARRP